MATSTKEIQRRAAHVLRAMDRAVDRDQLAKASHYGAYFVRLMRELTRRGAAFPEGITKYGAGYHRSRGG